MVGHDLLKEEHDNLKAESMSSMNKLNSLNKLKRRPVQKKRNEKKNADDEWKEVARRMKKEREERRNMSRYRNLKGCAE